MGILLPRWRCAAACTSIGLAAQRGLTILVARIAGRSDAGGTTFPARYSPLPKKPTDYLKQVYVDSLVFTPEALRHLVAEMSAKHVVVGTDYPYPWTQTAIEHVLATPELSDAERVAILGGTAARLLRIAE